MDIKKWDSRKLWVALLVFATAVVLLWFGKISSTDFVNITNWAFASYVIGNAADKFSERPPAAQSSTTTTVNN